MGDEIEDAGGLWNAEEKGGRGREESEKRESGKWKAEDWEAESENEEGKVGEVEK